MLPCSASREASSSPRGIARKYQNMNIYSSRFTIVHIVHVPHGTMVKLVDLWKTLGRLYFPMLAKPTVHHTKAITPSGGSHGTSLSECQGEP
jgi:hypothetical protein